MITVKINKKQQDSVKGGHIFGGAFFVSSRYDENIMIVRGKDGDYEMIDVNTFQIIDWHGEVVVINSNIRESIANFLSDRGYRLLNVKLVEDE